MDKKTMGNINTPTPANSDFNEQLQIETEQANIPERSSWDEPYELNKEITNTQPEPEPDLSHLRSKWSDEEEDDDWKDETKKPQQLQEIELYDPCKTLDENFEDDFQNKYLLISVNKNGSMGIENKIPDQFSKVVVDINKIEEFDLPEFAVIDYDTIFGLRLTSFINYNSDFFTCDERVFFEALLIKYKCFGYKPFHWSREVIWKELGIKKDRVNRIIRKFSDELNILYPKVIKTTIDGRPRQVTYFGLNAKKILELFPKIYLDKENEVLKETELEKYLNIKSN